MKLLQPMARKEGNATKGSDSGMLIIAFSLFFMLPFFGYEHLWQFVFQNNIQYKDIYGAIFSLNSVFLAFLFAYFTFLKTADNPFLLKAKKTGTYQELLRQIISTMISSALYTVVCLVVIAIQPVAYTLFEFHNFLLGIWTGWLALILLQFYRLNSLFWVFVSVE